MSLKKKNPMIGFRGAARYISDEFKDCFEVGVYCANEKGKREDMGLTNVELMIPFVRNLI